MRDNLNNFLRMLRRILGYNKKNAAPLATIPEYAAEEAKLAIEISNIESSKSVQQTPTKGITSDKNNLKLVMAEIVIQVAHKCAPFARNIGNETLLGVVGSETISILKARDNDALTMATFIKDTIVANQALFTNVTAQDITDMNTAITAFSDNMLNTQTEIAYKKAFGTTAYKSEFKNAGNIVSNMYDFVYGAFRKSNPALIREFKTARGISDYGKRYTGVIFYLDDMSLASTGSTAVQGVIVKNVETGMIVQSDISGIARMIKIKNGKYHFELSKSGYKTVLMIISIRKGRIERVEIEMEKSA